MMSAWTTERVQALLEDRAQRAGGGEMTRDEMPGFPTEERMTEEQIAEARALIKPLTGYTPGPLKAHDFCGEISVAPADINLDATALCTGLETGRERPRRELLANARLYAAAPAMRDTIAALLSHIDAQARREAEKDARIAALEVVLDRVEWSGRVEGQGCSTMSFYSPGPMHAACPVCRGLKPGQRADFIESAFGHKPDCSLRAALEARP